METIGATFGTASPHECKSIIIDPMIGLFDFVTADDVLTQISELKVESNISKSDAKKYALGEDMSVRHDVIATLDVIGNINGDISRQLQPIMPLTQLQRASSQQISDFLGFANGKDMVQIGELLRRSDVPVVMEKAWFEKHISIMGMTGAGKSNLSKVILHALKEWYEGTIIIIDPHGEYDDGNIIEIDMITGDSEDLDFDTVVERCFNILGRKDKDFTYLMEVAYISSTIRKKKLSKVGALREACSDYYVRGASSYRPIIEEAILTETIIRTVQKSIVQDKCVAPLIFNLKGVKAEVGEAVVSIAVETVYELVKTGRQIITFIDEAHKFCPQKRKAMSKEPIITLISEGRKFGAGVVIMSQRPAKVDKDIISQCNTQFCLKVKNDNDIRQLRASTEQATKEMFKEVQRLEPGQALLSSPWLKRPVFVKVMLHGGN